MTIAHLPEATLDMLQKACSALDDTKAENIRVLDVRETSPITDFLVVATGNSAPHLRALRSAVASAVKDYSVRARRAPTELDSGWVVVDSIDLVVHLFTEEQRRFYNLEALWKDAREIAVSDLLAKET